MGRLGSASANNTLEPLLDKNSEERSMIRIQGNAELSLRTTSH